jgi:hypothetical protein
MLAALVAWTALVLIGVAVLFGPGFSDPATETNVAFFVGLAGAVVIWLVGLVIVAALVIRRERRARAS